MMCDTLYTGPESAKPGSRQTPGGRLCQFGGGLGHEAEMPGQLFWKVLTVLVKTGDGQGLDGWERHSTLWE